MDFRMDNRTPFTVSLPAAKKLLGKTIRIRWIDEWGEAFYTGEAWYTDLYTGPDTPTSIVLALTTDTSSCQLVLPVGKELDMWIIPEEEGL